MSLSGQDCRNDDNPGCVGGRPGLSHRHLLLVSTHAPNFQHFLGSAVAMYHANVNRPKKPSCWPGALEAFVFEACRGLHMPSDAP
jgi:hypothetical protein